MKDKSEESLLAAYKKDNDQRYIAQLYKPYMPLIYGLCLKYFKNTRDAEDASMDVYLSIVKKLKTHEVKYFKSWLYVVAKNHCLDKLRSRNTKSPKENEANLVYYDQVMHPDSEVDEVQISKLNKCLELLSDNQKKSVDMFYYKKLSYKEISESTGWTWSNIRSHIQNGRRNLKNCMDK